MPGQYNRKDHLYQKAKDEGYRSRAAFKLMELDKRYRLLSQGARVLDLGAWPGGWLQIAAQQVGPRGMVVGLDLQRIEDLAQPNVHLLCGDAADESVIRSACEIAGARFDVVLSDMSPKISGIREVDQAAIVRCAELALGAAKLALIPGGSLVMKVFKNPEVEAFVKSLKPLFNKIARVEPESSRKTSNEFYLISSGYKA